MQTNVDDSEDSDDTPITTREWVWAVSVSVIGGALVIALIIWFAVSFLLQPCGYGPACG